jgi:hypothetical protein
VVKYISQAVSKQVTLIVFCGIAINERVIVKPTQKKKKTLDRRGNCDSKTIERLSSA